MVSSGMPVTTPHGTPSRMTDETDVDEDLREWLTRAESGEFGADPGVEATVRIVRALLDENDDADER